MRKVRTSSSRKSKPTKVSTASTPSMTVRNMNDPELPPGVKKPMFMTSLYLDPISIEPNVGMNEACSDVTSVMENFEAFVPSNKPRFVTTLRKSSVIVADRDGVNKNICVLISQVLGIDPKKNVVPDVSISLTQPDNNTKNPRDNPDVHAQTLSPEKSQDKERSEDITNDLDKNLVDQPTYLVNIEDLDSDDVPIGKGQVVRSSNTPSKSIRKKTSVGPTKRWSKVVNPTPKEKSLKRKDVPSKYSESDQDIEHNVQDIISTSRKQAFGKKIPSNIPEVPLDNIFFHSVENV
ncbi:uncharacterized protein LOC127080517 [Lathyrus oleraceus]|uniref:uncharacterized protein LOC127080517 n=1 Tax=Pisum sativum TaxID=3888 RepID=UPI0021CF0289|nr:uncharacterized protein LOC127080517 [Pisum sativum]